MTSKLHPSATRNNKNTKNNKNKKTHVHIDGLGLYKGNNGLLEGQQSIIKTDAF